MPPQVNATLTQVQGAGTVDDWDTPAAAGSVKWSGDADAYYREKLERLADAGEVNVLVHRTLWIDTRDARDAGLDTDDVLTFTNPAGVSQTAKAIAVAYSELDGIPRDLQTTRIDLQPL